jgi:hypothetical protein
MAVGRTLERWERVYSEGYDLSGHTRTVGPLSWKFNTAPFKALNANVQGVLPGNADIGLGTLQAEFDNTATTGILTLGDAGKGALRTVIVAQGIRAAPAIGDPAFVGQFRQTDFVSAIDASGSITISMPFASWDVAASSLLYADPWGILLHTNVAATAAYTSTGIDNGADSHKGGYMVYQVTSAAGAGNMTAAIKVQDSTEEVNGSYGDLLSSGTINCGTGGDTAVPCAGLVALATTATVKQFVRWQIALTTATSVTFVLAFVRGIHPNN